MSDSLYHRLFSHPLMVEQLVREFVPEAMALGIDFDGMERVNTKFHGRKGRRRESDVVWRLPRTLAPITASWSAGVSPACGLEARAPMGALISVGVPTPNGLDLFLYLLVEFQSQSDWWMAVRTQVYEGLLLQQVIAERKLKTGDRLPPVLMIVLFNGEPRWSAPTDLADLIGLPADSPLWPWQPQVRYHVLDMGAFPGDDLARRKSLAALLFRLEHRHEPEELARLIEEVIGWFRQHPGYEDLKALFTELVRQAIEGLGAPVTIPDDLMEMRTMLATQGEMWKRQWKAEGLAEGEAKGRAEGKAEMLLRLLHRRFGALTMEIEARVRTADSDRLDAWSERILDARTLVDVFDDQPH